MIEAGAELPPSPWLAIDQSRIDAFAEATEDRQKPVCVAELLLRFLD